MARSGITIITLMFLIVADASLVLNFRKAIRLDSSPATTTQNSPLPSPAEPKGSNSISRDAGKPSSKKPKEDPKVNEEKVTNNGPAASSPPIDTKTDNKPKNHEGKEKGGGTKESPLDPNEDAGKPRNEKPKEDPKVNEEPKEVPKVAKNGPAASPPPIDTKTDNKPKNHEGKKKGGGTKESRLDPNGSCKGLPYSCRIQNIMIACMHTTDKGSKKSVIVVQNEGEKTLKVNITIPATMDNAVQVFEIPSHQAKKVNVSVAEGKTSKIVLKAENRECVINMAPPTSGPGKDILKQLSNYSKQVTPIYGLYMLFVVALSFGGIWACCKLRKRRWQGGGVPYQELEMGLPESAAAGSTVVNMESSDGWDEGWDDYWDEDKAVKPPGGDHVGSISANGLTSRSIKKDGWDVDWDD